MPLRQAAQLDERWPRASCNASAVAYAPLHRHRATRCRPRPSMLRWTATFAFEGRHRPFSAPWSARHLLVVAALGTNSFGLLIGDVRYHRQLVEQHVLALVHRLRLAVRDVVGGWLLKEALLSRSNAAWSSATVDSASPYSFFNTSSRTALASAELRFDHRRRPTLLSTYS